MATRADVRRIALALPDTVEGDDRFAFSVLNKGKAKGFVWVWMERVEEKKPRVPNNAVIAVRVPNQAEKEMLLATDSREVLHRTALQRLPRRARAPEGDRPGRTARADRRSLAHPSTPPRS